MTGKTISQYLYRFGLVAILYDLNLQRLLRPSATVYGQEIAARK